MDNEARERVKQPSSGTPSRKLAPSDPRQRQRETNGLPRGARTRRALTLQSIDRSHFVTVFSLSKDIRQLGSAYVTEDPDDMSIHIESESGLLDRVHVVHLSPSMARIPGAEDLIKDAIRAGDDLLSIFLVRALEGKGSPLNKYVVVAPGPLFGVQLECELCDWALVQGQEPIPALMVRHTFPPAGPSPAPSDSIPGASARRDVVHAADTQRLLEDVPALLTLCDMDGRILFQVG